MIMDIEMEERQCIADKCNQHFRVSSNSPQLYHSNFCALNDPNRDIKVGKWKKGMAETNNQHAKLALAKKNAKSAIEKETSIKLGREKTTPNIVPSIMRQDEKEQRKTGRAVEQKAEPTIITTKKNVTKEEIKTDEKTSKAIVNTTGNTMQTIENSSLKKLDLEGSELIPLEVYTDASSTLSTVVLGSMNLIDESMKLMHESAKSLLADESETSKKTTDDYKIRTAISCVSEVRNLMKTKLEIARLALDIYGPVRRYSKENKQ